MSGELYSFSDALTPIFLEWVRPLRVKEGAQTEIARDHTLESDFGRTLEYLIDATMNGSLVELFRRIPVAEVPHDVWAEWKHTNSLNLHYSTDLLVERGLLQSKAAADLEFGEDINLEIAFNRSKPSVEVEFCRMWDSPETLFVASFAPKRQAKGRAYSHDLRVVATATQHRLAALGLVLYDLARPSAIRYRQPMDGMFEQQFKRVWRLPSADNSMRVAPQTRG